MKGSKSKFMLLVSEKAFFNDVSPVGYSNFVISIGIERSVHWDSKCVRNGIRFG
jgi:hypothetical protein